MFAKVFLIALVVWGWWFIGAQVGDGNRSTLVWGLSFYISIIGAIVTAALFIMAIATDFGGKTPLTGLM